MSFIIFCLFFGISYTINLFYLFNAVVPLFYIPYVLYKIIRGEYKFGAILMCVVAPVLWNLILIILGFVLALLGVYKYLNAFFNSSGAMWGGLLALISVILNAFSPQARQEFKEGLDKFKIYKDAE